MAIRQIELDDEDEEIIAGQIADGRYHDAAEVVKAGLASLEREVARDPEWIARLTAAAKIGFDQIDAGQYVTLRSDEEIRSFMDGILQEVRAASGDSNQPA